MKNTLLIMFAFCFFSMAQAQVVSTPGKQYREFMVKLAVSNGETKNVILEVNTELEVVSYGEPEIPAHGHYDYNVTGSIIEGEQKCNFELLLTQGKLDAQSTEEILSSRADRSGNVKLCSGLILELASVRTLLTDATMQLNLRARGLSKPIGTGSLVSNGLKSVPEIEPYED